MIQTEVRENRQYSKAVAEVTDKLRYLFIFSKEFEYLSSRSLFESNDLKILRDILCASQGENRSPTECLFLIALPELIWFNNVENTKEMMINVTGLAD